jgi:hypothetical protein
LELNKMPENTLYYGDNLPILREHIPDENVDLGKWRRFPPLPHFKIQILTIGQLLGRAKIQIPPAWGTFKQAQRVDMPGVEQPGLFE